MWIFKYAFWIWFRLQGLEMFRQEIQHVSRRRVKGVPTDFEPAHFSSWDHLFFRSSFSNMIPISGRKRSVKGVTVDFEDHRTSVFDCFWWFPVIKIDKTVKNQKISIDGHTLNVRIQWNLAFLASCIQFSKYSPYARQRNKIFSIISKRTSFYLDKWLSEVQILSSLSASSLSVSPIARAN